MQDTASGYNVSVFLDQNFETGGSGLFHSVEGQTTYSGSGTTTNWSFRCWVSGKLLGIISIGDPDPIVIYTNSGVAARGIRAT
jgi:hypothetical protein